jgi:hypothetical protein
MEQCLARTLFKTLQMQARHDGMCNVSAQAEVNRIGMTSIQGCSNALSQLYGRSYYDTGFQGRQTLHRHHNEGVIKCH